MYKSKEIDALNLLEEESVENQLKLLADYYPKFAISGNSTIKILETILLNQPNLKFNRCVIDRVYSKDDNKKRPLLYVYIDFPKTGKKFYYADKESKEFIKLTQEEFEIKFECYEKDIESFGGIRPWKQGYKEDNSKDLNKSSGTIVIEGEEK